MTAFDDLAALGPLPIWDGIAARAVAGERITLAVVELDPDTVVPEHSHENEQLGLVLRGSVRFRVGEEIRELGPGATWTIAANVPHEVEVGPDGAEVIDVFAPVREDWSAYEPEEPRAPRWPGR
jgi:quercetin dioxygenase-like cupin family protein